MAYEQKPNSGSLWPNDRKEKDTHPDLRGSINVNGVDYWINAWGKVSKDGKDWLSISVKSKDEQSGGGAASSGALSKWSRPVGGASATTTQTPPDRSSPPAHTQTNLDGTTDAEPEDVPF